MAYKRVRSEEQDVRPQKQAKLNFGQKMAPKPGSTASQPSKAVKSPEANSQFIKPSKDEITSKPAVKASNGFTVIEEVGDIFDAPNDTLIIHACNCIGSWGAGIAAAFRQRYPNAFETYKQHCKTSTPDQLIRKALLISPADGDPKHWVGCLFTSKRFGRGRDSAQDILDATAPSMEDLIAQVGDEGGKIKELRICQINSGLFNVPWEHSKAVIESLELDEKLGVPREVIVYSLPSK